MGFKEWAEPTGPTLPYKGREYVTPLVDAELGPRLEALLHAGMDAMKGGDIAAADKELLTDLEERELYPRLLGDAYGEMIEHRVGWKVIKHAAMTVIIDTTIDRDTAEEFWNAGPDAAKKARKVPKDKKPKGTGSKTGKASTAGTTNRAQRRAAGSPGKSSSKSGS